MRTESGPPQKPVATTARAELFAGPAGVTAGFAEFVFEVGEALLECFDLFLFGGDFGGLFVDVFASVLLCHRFLRVGVILGLRFAELALENVEFLFGAGDFVALPFEAGAPSFLGALGRSSRGGCSSGVATLSLGGGLRLGVGRGGGGSLVGARRLGDVVVVEDFLGLGLIFLLFAGFASGVRDGIAGLLRLGLSEEWHGGAQRDES